MKINQIADLFKLVENNETRQEYTQRFFKKLIYL